MAEHETIALSTLQHYIWCPRQAALLLLERTWLSDAATALGDLFHQKVHSVSHETRGNVRTCRSVPLRSELLGVTGVADVVEYHLVDETKNADISHTTTLDGLDGHWMPVPVEFKVGRPKNKDCDKVQLCAQAICLEEMHSVSIPQGYLFYGKTRKREPIEFSEQLRSLTVRTARNVHKLMESGVTPASRYIRKKCDRCSLLSACMPRAHSGKDVRKYIADAFDDSENLK